MGAQVGAHGGGEAPEAGVEDRDTLWADRQADDVAVSATLPPGRSGFPRVGRGRWASAAAVLGHLSARPLELEGGC